MSVSLKEVFSSLPFPVPTELSRANEIPIPCSEAVGVLRGVKDRMVAEIRAEAEKKVSKISSVIEQKIGELVQKDGSQEKSLKKRSVLDLFEGPLDFDKIVRSLFSSIVLPVVLISEREGVQDVFEVPLEESMKKLAANPEYIDLLKKIGPKVGIALPEEITEKNLHPFMKWFDLKSGELESQVRQLREIFGSCLCKSIMSKIPETTLAEIQKIFDIPEAMEAMQKAGVEIPSSVTRENVVKFLKEIGEKSNRDEKSSLEFRETVIPYLDAVFQTAEVEAPAPEESPSTQK